MPSGLSRPHFHFAFSLSTLTLLPAPPVVETVEEANLSSEHFIGGIIVHFSGPSPPTPHLLILSNRHWMAPTSARKPRVLVTNDDGPPSGPDGHSPFVYPFAIALQEQLGWDVRVVVPSSQKSWVGKGYAIAQTITGQYFYPEGPEGLKGEKLDLPKKPLGQDGDMAPWVLIDGTPATCANLGLYSLFPEESFDLIIAGPNFGRNTSTAFALSSGTLGSAMSGAISGTPAIALSFGLMEGHKPPAQDLVDGAVKASCKVVSQLWELGWGDGDDRVDVYSVNVPILPSMVTPEGPAVEWTQMARTAYQRLFKSVAKAPASAKDTGGPAAIPEPQDESKKERGGDDQALQLRDEHHSVPLKFIFSPDITSLVNPSMSTLVEGTDTHTIHSGAISVTPIRAGFEQARTPKHTWSSNL